MGDGSSDRKGDKGMGETKVGRHRTGDMRGSKGTRKIREREREQMIGVVGKGMEEVIDERDGSGYRGDRQRGER